MVRIAVFKRMGNTKLCLVFLTKMIVLRLVFLTKTTVLCLVFLTKMTVLSLVFLAKTNYTDFEVDLWQMPHI